MRYLSVALALALAIGIPVNALSDDAVDASQQADEDAERNGASRARIKAPFRLIYNNDTTNTAGVPSPWHKEGEPFREEMLTASIEEVVAHGVDAYMLSPGMGWVPWWQSGVDPDFYAWWQERTGLKVADSLTATGFAARGYDRYVFDGGDMVQVLVDTCRRHNMAPFVSLRLNDVHLQEYYNQRHFNSLVSCRLYAEHPEWHIDPQHAKREGYYKRRGMKWAVPEVRAYKLALITELVEKYDLAGLELDFLRDDTLFSNETPHAKRVDIITGFVRDVRKELDRTAASGKARYLCVRIPLQIRRHSATGLDVAKLHRAGVDMFNLSGWYHTTQRTDLATVRKRAPGAAVYLEMTHSTGWHPHFVKPSKYGTQGDPRTSDQQFYTTAQLAHRNGADGLSLFNFVYYRKGTADVPAKEPPFHVLDKLNDVPFLENQHRYYMAAGTSYFRQVGELKQTAPLRIELDMACSVSPRTDESQSEFPARLRVHTLQAVTAEHRLAITFNGTQLEPCDDTSGFFGNPYDGMISPHRHRRAWILPDGLIRDGHNTVVLRLESGGDLRVVYLDAGVPVANR